MGLDMGSSIAIMYSPERKKLISYRVHELDFIPGKSFPSSSFSSRVVLLSSKQLNILSRSME
jgi:hypothetical protein